MFVWVLVGLVLGCLCVETVALAVVLLLCRLYISFRGFDA